MENEIFEAFKQSKAKRLDLICKSFSNERGEGGEKNEEQNPFEKAAQEADLEKSDVMNAIQYGGDIKLSKTGKEIKEQVNTILIPELSAELSVKKKEADDCLKNCGQAPSKDVDLWWTNDLRVEVPYKIYDWEETRLESTDDRVVNSLSAEHSAELSKKYNFPKTADEVAARREYNDNVRAVCNVLVDLEACRICLSLKDDSEYELTPRQFATFRF